MKHCNLFDLVDLIFEVWAGLPKYLKYINSFQLLFIFKHCILQFMEKYSISYLFRLDMIIKAL